MRVGEPPPGEELNAGEVTDPRLAASVIVLRDAPGGGVEVLLVKRNPAASFMGGAWVFPGGSVHGDDDGPAGAALRELEEEAAVALAGTQELVAFSRWVTPVEVKVRFDTWFFVARGPEEARPACDGEECVDVAWVGPGDALAAGERDEMMLVFPTVKHLEQLAQFSSVDDALSTARARHVSPVLPRVVARDGAAEVLLPGEPGYDD